MTTLPESLRPWAAELQCFPPRLALSLGPWLARISIAFGPFRGASKSRGDDPDGYDGLERRGDYQRLLATEWPLAEELPEEFLRRAAMGEHAFLRRVFRQPSGARQCVALFDTGPDQLGAPRIAQLAVLIVLARRARLAGARFLWGSLQEPPEQVRDDSSPTDLLHLLQARTSTPATSEALERWMLRLGPDRAPDGLWLVGGPRLAKSATAVATVASRVALVDVLDARTRTVGLSLHRPGSSPVAVELLLPPPAECVRLLRDPFRTSVAEAELDAHEAMRAGGSGLLFAAEGQRLLVKTGPSQLVAFAVPNSPRASGSSLTAHRQASDSEIIAAGWHHRQLVVVSVQGVRVMLERRGKQGGHCGTEVFLPIAGQEPLPPAGGALGACLRPRASHAPTLVFHPSGCILALQDGHYVQYSPAAGLESQAGKALGLAYSIVQGWCFIGEGATEVALPNELRNAPKLTCRLGYPGQQGVLIALHADETDDWRVLSPLGERQFHPPSGTRVVGPALIGREVGLVLLERDETRLSLVTQTSSRTLVTTREPILHTALSPKARQVAFATRRELSVYSWQASAVVFRRGLLEGGQTVDRGSGQASDAPAHAAPEDELLSEAGSIPRGPA